jgi:hypothetical protein
LTRWVKPATAAPPISLCNGFVGTDSPQVAKASRAATARQTRLLGSAAIALENLALRHQLAILQRSVHRPRLLRWDRILWVWLSRVWTDWRASLVIVQPATVLAWHRRDFQLYWRWKSWAPSVGRPRLDPELRRLIRRMARENHTWGRRRIRAELGLLGCHLADLTVAPVRTIPVPPALSRILAACTAFVAVLLLYGGGATAADRSCDLKQDSRDCRPGWNCSGPFAVLCEIDKVRYKAMCEAAKELQNKAYQSEKLACETATAADKGLSHLSVEFCDLMTFGAYRRGEAGCGVSAGVGHDDKGFYTYDPADPDTKYRGDTPPSAQQTPTGDQLNQMAVVMNRTPPHYYEYDFKDVFGVERLLPGDYKFGAPWPASAGPIHPPIKSGIIREQDKEGGGSFLSPRFDKKRGEIRFHGGEDYVAKPGEQVFAPVTGEVIRRKAPGKKGLTGIEIKTPSGHVVSVFYVKETPEIAKALDAKQAGKGSTAAPQVTGGVSPIGAAQDLTPAYGKGITNHVHLTVQDSTGLYVMPSQATTVIKPGPDGKLGVATPKP